LDRLAPFFNRFALSARIFYSGRLCGSSGDHATERAGHLHVLRRGTLKILHPRKRPILVNQPSVLFYPRPSVHRFQASEAEGAEIVCAQIEFGAGIFNPLLTSLPEFIVLPLDSLPGLNPTVELLFAEAFADHPGRQPAVDRLAEYFLVLLLRAAMSQRLIDGGILSGLADPRLAQAITAMHEQPEKTWSLEQLAQLAGMSRARFAAHFREVVGMTPFDYLTDWRIGIAQTLLRKGEPLKLIAPAVGYTNPTALTRIFAQRTGLPPSAWLARNRRSPTDICRHFD
jgi:AraC-like DNA-binding protein